MRADPAFRLPSPKAELKKVSARQVGVSQKESVHGGQESAVSVRWAIALKQCWCPGTTLRPKPSPFWSHRCVGEAGQSGGQRVEVGVGGRGC